MTIRLHAFHCGGDRSDMAVFDPFAPDVGTKVYSPYFFYLIDHPRGRVLFDSGVHPELARDPRARLGEAAASFSLDVAPDDDVVSRLSQIGVGPGDIEHVVQSHLHYDHAGGLTLLPNARVHVQESELAFARDPPVYQRSMYVASDFPDDLAWNAVRGDHDLFGDGTVIMLATPGHTPGHQSLLVRLQSRPILLLSDATYLLEKMRRRLLPAVVWSPDAMVASWLRIEELEQRLGAELVCTHDLDFRERMRIAPDGFYA